MRELFRIGHISIQFFGMMIAIGVAVGLLIMLSETKRKKLSSEKVLDMLIYTIIAAVVGARLYFIIAFDFSYYLKNPIDIFKVNQGGLSIQGALIFGILFALWYSKKHKLPFLELADAAAPAIIMGQAIGRIGCDVFGIPMKAVYPWGIRFGTQLLHPAQMYEMLLDLILFTFLWTRRGKTKYDGQLFINYIIGFAIIRAIVEFFRTNPIVYGPFTIAHITSLGMIILAFAAARLIKNRESNKYKDMLEVDVVKVPIYQYLLVLLVAIIGISIYYYVNH